MSRIIEVSDALRELAQDASDAEREPLRQVLLEIASELQPSPVEKIRMATRMQPDEHAQDTPESVNATAQALQVKPRIPREEQERQITWVATFVQQRGTTTAREIGNAMVSEFKSVADRPEPMSCAMGRIRQAAVRGLVELPDFLGEVDLRKRTVTFNNVVCAPDSSVGRDENVPFDLGRGETATTLTSAGDSSEASVRDSGGYNPPSSGWPSVTSTAPATGHNGASAGQ